MANQLIETELILDTFYMGSSSGINSASAFNH